MGFAQNKLIQVDRRIGWMRFIVSALPRDENTPVFRAHLVSTWDTIEARLYDEAVLHYFDLFEIKQRSCFFVQTAGL